MLYSVVMYTKPLEILVKADSVEKAENIAIDAFMKYSDDEEVPYRIDINLIKEEDQ